MMPLNKEPKGCIPFLIVIAVLGLLTLVGVVAIAIYKLVVSFVN